MKENYVYPVILKKENDEILITAPDFPDLISSAETEEEAVTAAQEMISLYILDNEDRGIESPVPGSTDELKLENDEKLIYVHLWMPYFRQAQKVVYVKKTLTIPAWLDLLAKENNINFSSVLVKGLKSELGINNN